MSSIFDKVLGIEKIKPVHIYRQKNKNGKESSHIGHHRNIPFLQVT